MELYAIKSAAELIFSNRVTDEVEMIIDFSNSFSASTTAEVQYALENGSKSVAFSEGKEGTISIATQLVDANVLAMILGAEVVKTTGTMHKVQTTEVLDGKITLDETPFPGSAYVLIPSSRKLLKLGETATEETVSVAEKVVSFDPSYNGKIAKVYYLLDGVKINEFTVYANSNPKSYKLVGLGSGTGRTSGDPVILDMYFPKVTPKIEATIGFDTSAPSEFNIELDMLKDEGGRLFVFKEEDTQLI